MLLEPNKKIYERMCQEIQEFPLGSWMGSQGGADRLIYVFSQEDPMNKAG